MKLAIFTVLAVLASGASAGGGAQPEGTPPADSPAAARLDDAKCQTVWTMNEREGDTLSTEKAAQTAGFFISNFKMVDTNNDSEISQDEFKEGCKRGWVLEPEKTAR
jgi:hypothetical protein